MLSLIGGFYQNYYRDEKEEIGAISVLDSLGLGLVSPIVVTSPLVTPRSKLLLSNDTNETETTVQRIAYPETNEVYEGPVTADGKRHGQNATLINYSSYTPSDETEPKGRYHSSSLMTDSRQKRKFIGTFYNDQFLEGTLITPKYTYIGNFRHCNKFHGFGSLISFHSHPDIEFEYTGEFQLGKYHGVGKLITRYDNSNVPDDVDLKTSRISSMYKGEFVNGKKSGFGTMYHFRSCLPSSPEDSNDSKRHSQISYINPKDPNDVILHYSGEWKNDRKHGAGTLFSEHGTSVEYQGNFYKDRIVESTDENQNEAEGNTLNGEVLDEESKIEALENGVSKSETLENEVITYESTSKQNTTDF